MPDSAEWSSLTAQSKRAVIDALNEKLVSLRLENGEVFVGDTWSITRMGGELLPSCFNPDIRLWLVMPGKDLRVVKNYKIPSLPKARKAK